MRSEFLEIAEKILDREKRSLSARELIRIAMEEGLLPDKFSGKTPHQTMKSKLSVHIRRNEDTSVFVRTSPGRFYLRRLLKDPSVEYRAVPQKPSLSRESVLVFPSKLLDEIGRFQGILLDWTPALSSILGSKDLSYMNRLDAEQDDSHKQIVTYVMVRSGDEVLAFRRGTFNRVEDFLRGSRCMGFGGHVTLLDRDLFNTAWQGILRCAVRELSEELALPFADRMRLERFDGIHIVGLLNDDSSPVGRRHLAIVLEYNVANPNDWDQPARGEKSITQLGWLNTIGATSSILDFEYWSQLCLSTYFPEIGKSQPAYKVFRKRPLRPPHVLCIVGQLGSGKTMAARILKEEFGYEEVNSGRVLAGILGIPPIPVTTREEFQDRAWSFIQLPGGPEQLAAGILETAGKSLPNRLLIDGIRQISTLEALRRLAAPTRLGVLYVLTPPEAAFEFYKGRGEKQNVTIHDFLVVRENAVEQDTRSMIGQADAVLYNRGSSEQFRQAILDLMSEVLF